MNLITQIQGIGYSFSYALIASFFYHVINRTIIKVKWKVMKIILEILVGINFATGYYLGLIFINEGIIKLYFILVMIFGYLIYELYFHQNLIGVIDFVTKYVKCVFLPIRFVFRKFNDIMKNTKRVIMWKRKGENHS